VGRIGHETPLGATLAGLRDMLARQRPIGALHPTDRLDARRCLVTGANAGLGKAVATELARRGARVVMAGRTMDEKARADIVGASCNPDVELEHLDLADLAGVRSFCRRMADRGRRFEVVVINAGVVPLRSRRTVDGFDEMLQVNYLANFLLVTTMLADGTIPSGVHAGGRGSTRAGFTPRIVFVSSETHRSAPPVDLDRLGELETFSTSGVMEHYGRAKVLLTTFAVELSRRLAPGGAPDVSVHALCPGAVNTRIAREAPAWSRPLLRVLFATLFRSPARAAGPAVYLACSRGIEGRTGIYLHVWTEKDVSAAAADPATGRALWERSGALLRSRGFERTMW
jgi:NAD(P)-dependent dehydrogenase (short-subunit alcohol dehydrogenase family)